MKIHKIRRGYLLKTSTQKCVCVQRKFIDLDSGSHQLIAENVQENDPGNTGKVTVYDIVDEKIKNKKYMAFCFEVGDKAIFPAVAENEIKCEVLSPNTKFPVEDKTFLFEWGGERRTSDWQSLRSVAYPSKYLFLEDNINANPRVTIKPIKMPDFKIEKNRSTEVAEVKLESPREHVNSTGSRRLCFMSRESNQQTFYCDPTVLSIKSTYRHKRKIKKIKMSVKSRMPQQQDPDQMLRNRRADDSFMVL